MPCLGTNFFLHLRSPFLSVSTNGYSFSLYLRMYTNLLLLLYINCVIKVWAQISHKKNTIKNTIVVASFRFPSTITEGFIFSTPSPVSIVYRFFWCCVNTYIWSLEKWYQWTHWQGGNRDADVDTAVEGEGGANWKNSMKHVHYHV